VSTVDEQWGFINVLETIVYLNNLYHPCDKQSYMTEPINVRSDSQCVLCGTYSLQRWRSPKVENNVAAHFNYLMNFGRRPRFLQLPFNHYQLVGSCNYICLD